jgi:hypothetical protein
MHSNKKKSCLNPQQFRPTNISLDQQQYNTNQKKTGDAIGNNNLTWIEGRNYQAKK